MSDADLDELKAAKEKLTTSAQGVFTKMYESMQQQGGQAGPDMSGFTQDMGGTAQGSASSDDAEGDVVDGDYREV